MEAKFFSSIKKYKKPNTIGFESVPLNIKIGFFGTKKEHTFFGFPHMYTEILSIFFREDTIIYSSPLYLFVVNGISVLKNAVAKM